mmetsp:Transcript_57038/g.152197  ORF Transcript_57038/g.152197 Transcript_57038/m.152197 type:complete len:242 (-) Transcript_57038:342-1067(-)
MKFGLSRPVPHPSAATTPPWTRRRKRNAGRQRVSAVPRFCWCSRRGPNWTTCPSAVSSVCCRTWESWAPRPGSSRPRTPHSAGAQTHIPSQPALRFSPVQASGTSRGSPSRVHVALRRCRHPAVSCSPPPTVLQLRWPSWKVLLQKLQCCPPCVGVRHLRCEHQPCPELHYPVPVAARPEPRSSPSWSLRAALSRGPERSRKVPVREAARSRAAEQVPPRRAQAPEVQVPPVVLVAPPRMP